MTPEDRLRAALRETAGQAAPDPAGPEHVLTTAAQRRRRTVALSSLAVTALVVIAGIAVFRDGSTAEVRTVPATRTTTAPPARPSTAVVVTAQGAVVLVGTSDGRAARTLAPAGSADPTRKAVRSPDGATVYFGDQAIDCGWSDLFEVPADGSRPPRAIAKGHAPAVSPDGTRLAYATADGCVGATLVVRDLATGAEVSWSVPDGRPPHPFALGGISAIDWAPDNRRVAFQMDEHGGVHVLDTLLPGLLTAAAPVEPRQQPADTSLGLRSWHPEGGLAVAVQCCRNPDGMTSERVRTTSRTLLVDVATNEATPLLADGEYAWSLDLDASGEWLAWLDDGRIVMQGPDGRMRRVAEGFGAVSW